MHVKDLLVVCIYFHGLVGHQEKKAYIMNKKTGVIDMPEIINIVCLI